MFNMWDLVWYSGPHLQHGLYIYKELKSTHTSLQIFNRHKIQAVRVNMDQEFVHIFEVDEIDIRLATRAEKLLYNK